MNSNGYSGGYNSRGTRYPGEYEEKIRTPRSASDGRTGSSIPSLNYYYQPSIPRPLSAGPYSGRNGNGYGYGNGYGNGNGNGKREGFAGPRQGDDEDWDPDAKIDIPETTAVAKTHGDVA